jgi:signal peptidase II
LTETETEKSEASDVVAHEPQPDLQPPPPVSVGGAPPPAEPSAAPVAGERLGVPQGATPLIADYGRPHPSFVLFLVISLGTLAADVASKAWAASHLDGYPGLVEVWKNHLTFILAKNRGGAWGLLQSTSENVRRPFFLLVSVAAIIFILALYRRLQVRQRALTWGLPLVFGGALGNVLDRVRYGHVIDFIDAHGVFAFKPLGMEYGEHHWPTFNVADIAICVGVGLMAIDMFTSKRGGRPGELRDAQGRSVLRAPRIPPAQSGEPSADWNGSAHHPEAAPVEPSSPETDAPPVLPDPPPAEVERP